MLRFHALCVECFSEFEEVLTIHFDDQAEHYMALQVWNEGFEDNAAGIGMVHVEVDSQLNSVYDCFTAAELRRTSFYMCFDHSEQHLAQFGEVEVTFTLAAEKFEQLHATLSQVFREFRAYRVVVDERGPVSE